jgi:hypothetical protein
MVKDFHFRSLHQEIQPLGLEQRLASCRPEQEGRTTIVPLDVLILGLPDL